MKATIEKTFEVDHPIEQVWEFLADPTKVVVCVPGASITEKVDEQNYKGKVSMKFGPVSAGYDGEIKIENLDVANRTMILSGTGLDSKGKGSAKMKMNGVLKELAPGKTEVNYSMDISVIGKLAQFGSRLIVDVSNQVVEQFIGNFKKELGKQAPVVEPDPVAAVAAAATAPTAQAAQAAAAPPPPEPQSAPAGDNSLNVFTLLVGLLKSMLGRLFGKKS